MIHKIKQTNLDKLLPGFTCPTKNKSPHIFIRNFSQNSKGVGWRSILLVENGKFENIYNAKVRAVRLTRSSSTFDNLYLGRKRVVIIYFHSKSSVENRQIFCHDDLSVYTLRLFTSTPFRDALMRAN